MQEYEVITTYSDGSKESDGGMQSMLSNLVLTIVIAGIMILLAIILQPIRIIIMGIKYAVHFKKVEEKPSFIKSGFLILIMGVVCFFLGILIGGGIQKSYHAKIETQIAEKAGMTVSEYRAEKENAKKAKNDAYNAVISAAKKAATERVTAKIAENYSSEEGTPIFSNPVPNWENVATWVKEGAVLSITGDIVKEKNAYGFILVPVEYKGVKGYINVKYLVLE